MIFLCLCILILLGIIFHVRKSRQTQVLRVGPVPGYSCAKAEHIELEGGADAGWDADYVETLNTANRSRVFLTLTTETSEPDHALLRRVGEQVIARTNADVVVVEANGVYAVIVSPDGRGWLG